ncbi:hypothetical protein ATN84_20145 [Paramesorhizobium deserti]|uniref:WbqC-like protein n=1 Tax=Paramesorhizobium deserti TaxID=1494590 RepID=A0A135HP69_9HYPH|nr:WbqC family protein [Paramesorhizobium deserti]KXF75005.1 hypothetical protein ATN84_20145 [Paramesorhizobium deserti]
MKTICIIQPYVFPYLPYFQLAGAVDEFWVFDDVQYIRRGWMNRNYILNNGQRQLFTLPISKGHQGDLILDKKLPENFASSIEGLKKNLSNAYARAPYLEIIQAIFDALAAKQWHYFLDFSEMTLGEIFRQLGIETAIQRTSKLLIPDNIHGANRIIEVCRRVGANRYVNPIGGVSLYNHDVFAAKGLQLNFLEGILAPYPQHGVREFEPGLSILDLIAWTDPADYAFQLRNFKLR